MGRLEAIWKSLTERQRLALGALGSWLGAWAVGVIASAAATRVPALMPVALWISIYLMNWYAGMLLTGGMLVAFGPNLITAIQKKVFWSNLFGIGVLAVAGFGIYTLVYNVGFTIIYWPRLYDPPAHAKVDANGRQRTFTSSGLREIKDVYNNSTEVQADREFAQRYQGKWIAITSAVVNVKRAIDSGIEDDSGPHDTVTIGMNSNSTLYQASLDFDQKWLAKVDRFPIWSRIYAVCKIESVTYGELNLTSCELAPPT